MLTHTERDFVIEILKELVALSDPSDYLEEEVDQAVEILEKLKPIDNAIIMRAMEKQNARNKNDS